MIYNDAYAKFAGTRHPALLGSKVLEGWPEASDLNRQVMEAGLAGETLSFRTKHLLLNRSGRPEDVWVDLDYSPVVNEFGKPVGVLAVVVETTETVRTEMRLREREAELARVQQIGSVGGVEVFLTNGFRNRRSPEYLAIHGLPPEAAYETHEDWVRRIHPDDREKTEGHFIDAVRNGARDYAIEYRIVRPIDAQVRWISVKAKIERDAEGRPLRLVGAHIDITERKIVEEALRESETRFRLVAESAPVMLWMGDAEGKCLYLNKALRDFWGLELSQVSQFDWGATLHQDDRGTLGAILGEAMRNYTPFSVEARYRRADGEFRMLRTNAQPRFDAAGAFLGMIGANADITETKRAEEQVRMLMREITHRSKNLLAVVQAIAGQTATSSDTLDEFQSKFIQRVRGLAASHDLLVEAEWRGALVGDLVREQLAPFAESGSRLDISGPEVALTAQAAQPIGLALHELATNATKYGAWSTPRGKVRVSWAYSDNHRLRLDWTESGGPLVQAPRRKGFGHVVLESMVALSLGGEVHVDYAPSGLRWTLSLPHERIVVQ